MKIHILSSASGEPRHRYHLPRKRKVDHQARQYPGSKQTVTVPGWRRTCQPLYSPATHSHSRIPSKLRDSSTAPYNHRSPGSSSSRESSPGAPTPSATSSFTQSPNLSDSGTTRRAGRRARGRGRPLGSGTGPPKRSPPTQVQRPPVPQVMHSHYGMDVDEGEETGSSTDTSESS
ncbi:hypothetical protein NMY22_g20055 [Coprinellus aureogranulatus]|nr:hypothetical protein NMY22_g20055 [Coprinellus aureogranulatus]